MTAWPVGSEDVLTAVQLSATVPTAMVPVAALNPVSQLAAVVVICVVAAAPGGPVVECARNSTWCASPLSNASAVNDFVPEPSVMGTTCHGVQWSTVDAL